MFSFCHHFPAARVLLHSVYGAFVFWRIPYMSLSMCFFGCPCVYVCDKVQECVYVWHLYACIMGCVCMCVCVCVTEGGDT